jgi:nitrogen-specific signal transduction histidine kinase
MEMKSKNYIYIFVILFLVLIGIQTYLLMNSFHLKKREIYSKTKEKLGQIDDTDALFDNDLLNNQDATAHYINLVQGNITLAQLENSYSEKAKRAQHVLTHYVDSIFSPLGLEVKLQKEILQITFKNTEQKLLNNPIVVYKTNGNLMHPLELSSGTWATERTVKQLTKEESAITVEQEDKSYSFLVLRKSTFEVVNINWVVFKELAFLLLNTLLILIALLFLFYKTYQNLKKQQKKIGQLHDTVDNISHELKTPIATLKVALKTLEKHPDPTIIAVMTRQLERLEQTLEPLNEPKKEISKIVIANHQIATLLSDFKLAHPDIHFEMNDITKVVIPLNDVDFNTILVNLMDNSIKYGATQLHISITNDQNLCKIQVRDNGIGIIQKEIPHIFEKFYRIQKNNIHDTKGLGLGLYLINNIVNRHQGNIQVSSKQNQGTTFNISIPHEN